MGNGGLIRGDRFNLVLEKVCLEGAHSSGC